MAQREFSDRVAVVTGAANGIGRALALQAAREGMSVVLADVDLDQLAVVSAELDERGALNRMVPTDVSDLNAMEHLAAASYQTFGRVDLLFNNAGVLLTGNSWQQPPVDWRWLFEINVMGVVNGLHAFVPRLLQQEHGARIINTASVGALMTAPMLGAYSASKMAVRGITETLREELEAQRPDIGVSLLCPGPIETAITETARRLFPGEFAEDAMEQAAAQAPAKEANVAYVSPQVCAQAAFEGIRREQFWIFTHPEMLAERPEPLAGWVEPNTSVSSAL